MIESGNDWWFAFDNINVTTNDGFNDMEDFEGLNLIPFEEAGGGDGTDWTDDVPGWDIDNSQMVPGQLGDGQGTISLRTFQTGPSTTARTSVSPLSKLRWMAALDVASWEAEQGGQGRTLFNLVDPNNTTMVADGDAFYDYDSNFEMTGGAPDKALNTYVSRTYDLSGFDSTSLFIQFEYEFRVENEQLAVAEVSLDGGDTYTRFLSLTTMTEPTTTSLRFGDA